MPKKTFELSDIGQIDIYKHQAARSLRVTIQPHGQVRVTIPRWLPYKAGIEFARSRSQWIQQHRMRPSILEDGQRIGKSHRLRFIQIDSTAPKTLVKNLTVTVYYSKYQAFSDETVQNRAKKAAEKALRSEAEALLPQRLSTLAGTYGFRFKSVGVRRLKSRWGSCSSKGDITLNSYLMTLPWELIDYVLLHELTHTQIHSHGSEFWDKMMTCDPHSKDNRKSLKTYSPAL